MCVLIGLHGEIKREAIGLGGSKGRAISGHIDVGGTRWIGFIQMEDRRHGVHCSICNSACLFDCLCLCVSVCLFCRLCMCLPVCPSACGSVNPYTFTILSSLLYRSIYFIVGIPSLYLLCIYFNSSLSHSVSILGV